jgi:precorrin-8X/cobalt-precorrin-8 methylmutase
METKHYIALNPSEIETRSFEIITAELGHAAISESISPVIKRVIHTTADFDYARILEFHPNALEAAATALKSGCNIYSDTRMIIAGVNKAALQKLNCSMYTYIDDESIAAQSKQLGITRSILGIDKTCGDKNVSIYVIGNAPTALVRIYELIREGRIAPALVIAVPVGFVGASESKELIKGVHTPYIVTNGRKGGSTVAVAILNALLYMNI